jgi:hypothetical protein
MSHNPIAQAMITLCVESYIDETPLPGESIAAQQARMLGDINSALTNYPGGWQVTWGPALSSDRANMMYVAGSSSGYAVVIRGTDWSFILDWLEDFTSILLVPAPYNLNVKIAAGTLIGIETLDSLTANGQSLRQYLKTIPSSARLYVTGHSLGGCLASAYAPWLVTDGFGGNTMEVHTFAGPTAGDQSFATYYNTLFGSRSIRYYNDIDLVPNGWATIPAIKQLFNPSPTCPSFVKDIIDWALPHIPRYVQPSNAIALPGKIYWSSSVQAGDPLNDILWGYQVANQHSSSYYAQLLGVTIHAQAAKAAATIRTPPPVNAPPRVRA